MRLLLTVTFNENQLRAHLEPLLSLDEVETAVLVADARPSPLPKLRVVVPPRVLRCVLGRAGAKLVVCIFYAIFERPDWVIGFNLVPHGANAVIAAALSRTRSVYYMIGGEEEWEGGGWRSDNALLGGKTRPNRILERALLFFVRRATAIAVMGERGRSALVGRGVDPGRVHIVPASVDPSRFHASAAPPKEYDVLTIASLIERKRVDDFIRAVARIRENRDIRAAIVGSGPLEQELRDLADRLRVADAVDFLGFRADAAALLTRSRIFALTSRYEGLSIAVGEAMACAVPVVATDVGEISSLVKDGENGFLCPVGRPEALAARIETLLDDDVLRAALGRRAAEDAARRLRPEAVAKQYRGLLGLSTQGGR